jgi:putative peptide zinc metalloprotease protein
VAGAVYFATGFAPLAIFAVVSQAMALYQFLPFIRMDGYYIMSDLVGVPNLFVYLGPVLLSLVRRHDPANAARLRHLKPQARRAIKVWSVVTVAFLAFNFGFIAILAPVILPSEWAAIHLQGQAIVAAFSHNDLAGGVNDVIDLVFLAVAPLGMLLIAGILLRRVLGAIRRWWPTHPKTLLPPPLDRRRWPRRGPLPRRRLCRRVASPTGQSSRRFPRPLSPWPPLSLHRTRST